jgi:hypothetical protein
LSERSKAQKVSAFKLDLFENAFMRIPLGYLPISGPRNRPTKPEGQGGM